MLEFRKRLGNGPWTRERPRRPARAWSPTATIRVSIAWHVLALVCLILWPDLWVWWCAAAAASHVLLGLLGMLPRNQLLGPNLVKLPESCARQGVIALCFDDGPDPAVTPRVLDLLEQAGATASFFCVGRRAREHPAVVADIIGRGHSVENHTDRHPLGFAAFGMAGMRGEIERAQTTLAGLAGRAPRFFRGPAGLRSPLLDPVLARCGLRYVTWSRRGHDSLRRDAGQVLRRLTSGLGGGDILVLHDGCCARTRDGVPVVLTVLPDLLAEVAARGLRAMSLREALAPERAVVVLPHSAVAIPFSCRPSE